MKEEKKKMAEKAKNGMDDFKAMFSSKSGKKAGNSSGGSGSASKQPGRSQTNPSGGSAQRSGESISDILQKKMNQNWNKMKDAKNRA